MFGHSITPVPGPSNGFVPAITGSPSPLPQWRMDQADPIKQPKRNYGADLKIPQADRITSALLAAIF
jgi:hypothetical protein